MQCWILGIIINVVVSITSVNGFIVSSLKLSTIRNPNDPILSSSSSRSVTVVDAIDERNDHTSSNDSKKSQIDDTIQDLLDTARRLGPVGVRNTIEEQERIQSIVTQLKQQLEHDRSISGVDNANYTDIPLVGVHDLIYSAAPGGSSGKIGPYFYGKVTQTFVNETTFMNAVDFGPLNIALTATRHIKDSTTFIVKFQSTTISLFDIPLIEKSIRGTGGVWKLIYTGIVHDENIVMKDGNKKRILLRIMETPSLFIIEHDLSSVN